MKKPENYKLIKYKTRNIAITIIIITIILKKMNKTWNILGGEISFILNEPSI